MIISMRPQATRVEIDHVCERIREFGYKVHSIEGEERVVIGAVGMGATLSLPGIAGLALTVGMAVDANILIFERMKEEMKRGTWWTETDAFKFTSFINPCELLCEASGR